VEKDLELAKLKLSNIEAELVAQRSSKVAGSSPPPAVPRVDPSLLMQYNALKDKCKELVGRNVSLAAEYTKIQTLNRQAMERIQRYEAANERLIGLNDDQKVTNEKMLKDNSELTKAVKALTEGNATLTQQVEKLSKENTDLSEKAGMLDKVKENDVKLRAMCKKIHELYRQKIEECKQIKTSDSNAPDKSAEKSDSSSDSEDDSSSSDGEASAEVPVTDATKEHPTVYDEFLAFCKECEVEGSSSSSSN
jgi:hypothetical protein